METKIYQIILINFILRCIFVFSYFVNLFVRIFVRVFVHSTCIIFVLMFGSRLRMFLTIHLFQEIESVCFDIMPKARNISNNKTFPRNWWFVFESRSMFRFVVKLRVCFVLSLIQFDSRNRDARYHSSIESRAV